MFDIKIAYIPESTGRCLLMKYHKKIRKMWNNMRTSCHLPFVKY